jgi:hypothetical protein
MRIQSTVYSGIYKFLLRFFAIIFCLWLFPFPFILFSFTEKLFAWYDQMWGALVPLIAKTFFGITHSLPLGSDDTYSLIQLLLFAIIALLVTAIWTMATRRPKKGHLLYWLTVYIRCGLAYMLLIYAMGKLLKYQFTFPGPFYFSKTYGESTPMELLWNFMGYSYPYNLFTGIAEASAAIFLFFRRTASLGALMAIGVMSNVVMMNFGYDINVKFVSSFLLLMAIYLLVPDLKQLYYFFFKMRPASLENTRPVFENKSTRYILLGIEAFIIMATVGNENFRRA